MEFTRHAHKKIKEHFKDVVEWMVHKKLNPAFPRADPVYQVAFYKLNDEVKGYAGSKFLSSAWMGDFARAIKARPEFHEAPLPPDVFRPSHHCDACNRTNRPAAFIITFGGKAYHPETLEKLSEDDENEAAESDDDAKSRDALGNVLPSTEKEYFVGRQVLFCPGYAQQLTSAQLLQKERRDRALAAPLALFSERLGSGFPAQRRLHYARKDRAARRLEHQEAE